ncbi:hypothetical protein RhiirA1_436347, partial [Rhizophagus irregularis]
MKVIEKILWNKVIREAEYDKKEMEECVTKFQKLRVEPYERLVKRLKSLSKVLHLMGIHTLKYRNFDYLKYDRKVKSEALDCKIISDGLGIYCKKKKITRGRVVLEILITSFAVSQQSVEKSCDGSNENYHMDFYPKFIIAGINFCNMIELNPRFQLIQLRDNTLECNSTSSFPGTKFFINVGQKFLMEDYEVFKITKLSEFIIAKHKIDKISSFVKFTLQECAKILVNTFGRINSIMKFSVQICANFIFQVYSIIKYTLRKCAEILFDTMKFIFRRCSDIVFQICSIMKFGVRSCAYFIFQVYSIIKNTLQECAKILFNTIKIIFQRCTDVVYKIYSIIKFIFQRCADIIFTTYLITNFTFQICITIIFQSYSIIKFTFRKCIDILYTIFQKGKFYSVIKFMSTIAIFQGCANIIIILYQRDKINSIVKFASIPIVSLTSTSTVISTSISINLSFQYVIKFFVIFFLLF